MEDDRLAAWLAEAVAGDADALQRLMVHYHVRLRALVNAQIEPSLRRYLDPDDVIQETFAAAFRAIGPLQFDAPGAFYKWLETVARNQLQQLRRNLHRKRRDVKRNAPEQASSAASYPDLLARLSAGDSTPSRKVARKEQAALVLSSLARLTDEQRAVVRMRFFEERTVAEIAAALGKSEPAIHMLCHRGLKELRKHLGSISRFLSA